MELCSRSLKYQFAPSYLITMENFERRNNLEMSMSQKVKQCFAFSEI